MTFFFQTNTIRVILKKKCQGAAINMHGIGIAFDDHSRCSLSLSISRSRVLCVKGAHFRYLSVSSGSVEQQILQRGLSDISPYSRPTISQISLLQLVLDAGLSSLRFFHGIGLLLN